MSDLVPAYRLLAEIAYLLPPDNPERLWTEFLANNHERLYTAVTELGLVVEEGPNFIDRLKAAVVPKLVAMKNAESGVTE